MPHFTCNLLSYTLHRAIDINVIIPGVTSSEAEEPDVTHRPRWKYPVLYLLHGYCNDYSTWGRYTSLERYAEERRIAVVTFSAENNMYMKLEDMKQPNPIPLMIEPDYEKLLMKEIPEFVTAMFPVSEKPEDTYIAGLSMGGFGAMCHGFANPGRFRAVGAFSPLPSQIREAHEADEVPEYLRKYEPLLLLQKAVEQPDMPAFYYSYGDKDFLFEQQEWFRGKLDGLSLDYKAEVLPGYGHEWAFWDLQLERFLDWIPRTDAYYRQQPKRMI